MTEKTPKVRRITRKAAKAKGRRLQNLVRDLIREALGLPEDGDVRGALMGEAGVDIKLSPAARKVFSWAVECKNLAAHSIYSQWGQARTNANKERMRPLLVLKVDRREPLAVIRLEDFMELVKKI